MGKENDGDDPPIKVEPIAEGDEQHELPPGTVILKGDIPDDIADFAREVAAGGGAVVVTDISAKPVEVKEGLPTTVEIKPVVRSNN